MKDYSNLDQILPHLRSEYSAGALNEAKMHKDAMEQFARWFEDALAANVNGINAMTLSTADQDGRVSSRIVLLKAFGKKGFVFFTNYSSQKGRELAENPHASLLFFWPEMERQVSVSGACEPIHPAASDEYFEQRPFEAQVAASVSKQSQVIVSRAALEKKYKSGLAKYKGKDVPRPGDWGGYLLQPQSVEFWQGRANRLNDRIRYLRTGKSWAIERIQP